MSLRLSGQSPPRPPDLLAVVDHRDARRRSARAAPPGGTARLSPFRTGRGARHVVRGEVGREEMAGAHLLARLQVAVEGHRPPPPLEPAESAALEREVEAGVHLVARRTRDRATGRRRPRPRRSGRNPSPAVSRVRLRCSCQNGWSTCLTVSSRKPSSPTRLASPSVGVQQVVGDLGQLGLEVGQAGDAGGQVVLAAGAERRRCGTSRGSWGR